MLPLEKLLDSVLFTEKRQKQSGRPGFPNGGLLPEAPPNSLCSPVAPPASHVPPARPRLPCPPQMSGRLRSSCVVLSGLFLAIPQSRFLILTSLMTQKV